MTTAGNNLFFNYKLRGTKFELFVNQKLSNLYKKYQTHLTENGILASKMNVNDNFIGKEIFSINEDRKFLKDLQNVSLIVLFAIVIGLIYNLYLQEKFLESQIEKKKVKIVSLVLRC
ncbi:hypothetical protein N824_01825 [Pedobacter sp. V48]|nr:hypothetical protein N824_01825 [Pedobacter sp. V48]